MLEKLEKLILLYDFYGPLLTDRQKQAIELYYEADLGLSEVARQMGITRQGVYDLLKRTENTLEEYELKLRLVAKFQEERERIQRVYRMLCQADDGSQPWIREAIQVLAEVLEIDNRAEGSEEGGI
ncbi:MAG: DNA-binding protein [Syntrophomonadaceae bacterium]|nr:DNA-binding protein [Syntrophomonadaceae bacterium]